ncbi:MAG: hypothetical protein LBV48_02410 [Mycoplasmataceae bacterium]|jgi:hypothetical protein|nr:hypothetical protein [Mycoplasmataceae bacterium]
MNYITKTLMLPFVIILFILNIAMVSLSNEINTNFWWPIDIADAIICLSMLIMIHKSYHNDWKKMDKKDQIKVLIKSCAIALITLIVLAWIVVMSIGECKVAVAGEVIFVLRGLNWLMLGVTSYLFINSLVCFITKKIKA